jgi:hypothetical protein
MVALDAIIKAEAQQAGIDSQNADLPLEVRKAQAQNATSLNNFRKMLGVPENITPEMVDAIAPPKEGATPSAAVGMFLDAVGKAGESAGELRDELGGDIPTISTQEELNKAIEEGTLKSGDRFMDPAGDEHTVD